MRNVSIRWTINDANRVRDTLIARQQILVARFHSTDPVTELGKDEQKELGELTDILARDFDWHPRALWTR